jgi:hypothetical protein
MENPRREDGEEVIYDHVIGTKRRTEMNENVSAVQTDALQYCTLRLCSTRGY